MKNLKILKNLSILVVDDDKFNLENIKETLEIFFAQVYTAYNGSAALKLYKKHTIHMLITDYVMPIMNGYELCLEIRKNNTNIPLAIMSNYTDKEKLLSAIPLQLSEYIVKPIEYKTLISTLLCMTQQLENKLISQKISEEIVFNIFSNTLTINGKSIVLTKNESILIELFLNKKNSLVTHEMIEFHLENEMSVQAIKNLIFRLRKKLGKDYIINVQSIGYMMRISD